PYGRAKAERLVIASTDPATFPEATTWYRVTNLPAPGALAPWPHAPVAVAEVVRLYGLRVWVEQSYKQVKQTLGWTEYQVRADRAIGGHWQLVVCAFSFCWWAEASLAGPGWGLSATAAHPTHEVSGQEEPVVVPLAAVGKKKPRRPRSLRRAPKLAPRFAP